MFMWNPPTIIIAHVGHFLQLIPLLLGLYTVDRDIFAGKIFRL